MEGLHPWFPRESPEPLVHATTGKATATSPFSGAVVVEPMEAAGAGGGVPVPSSDVPHPARTIPIAPSVHRADSLDFMCRPPRADDKPPEPENGVSFVVPPRRPGHHGGVHRAVRTHQTIDVCVKISSRSCQWRPLQVIDGPTPTREVSGHRIRDRRGAVRG